MTILTTTCTHTVITGLSAPTVAMHLILFFLDLSIGESPTRNSNPETVLAGSMKHPEATLYLIGKDRKTLRHRYHPPVGDLAAAALILSDKIQQQESQTRKQRHQKTS